MREYISIVIVYHEGKPPKTIRVKKNYLKALFAFLAMLLSLSLMAYMFGLSQISEKVYLKARVAELAEENKRMSEKKEELNHERSLLRQKVRSLESHLSEIEEYLSKRGLVKKRSSVGGPSHKDMPPLDLSRVEFLEKRAEHILSSLRGVPLGYPVYGRINSHMGWRKNPFGKGYEFHTGIDIEAPMGSEVRATADGMVEFVGRYKDYGNTVVLRHPSGYQTLYAHLSKMDVKVGEEVKAGQVLGRVGSTGRSTGPHLHYEVLKDGRQLNPLDFLVL